jgi:hypothetical protein
MAWTGMDDPRAIYHSGEAHYSTSFHLPEPRLADDVRVILDLGEVASLAEVTLNGENHRGPMGRPLADRCQRLNPVRAQLSGDSGLELMAQPPARRAFESSRSS